MDQDTPRPARNLLDSVQSHVDGMVLSQIQRLSQLEEFAATVRRVQEYCGTIEDRNFDLVQRNEDLVNRLALLEGQLGSVRAELSSALQAHSEQIATIEADAQRQLEELTQRASSDLVDVQKVAQQTIDRIAADRDSRIELAQAAADEAIEASQLAVTQAIAEKDRAINEAREEATAAGLRAGEALDRANAETAAVRQQLASALADRDQLNRGITLLMSAIETSTLSSQEEDERIGDMVSALKERVENGIDTQDAAAPPPAPVDAPPPAELPRLAPVIQLSIADLVPAESPSSEEDRSSSRVA